jgi:hypothetical protein
MPYAMKQRADGFKEQTGKPLDAASDEDRLRFVHYTSAEAALSIINSKRIWMRNASCMSDYREVQHGFDILQKYFADKDRSARFSAALDACAPGVAQEAIKLFDRGPIPKSVHASTPIFPRFHCTLRTKIGMGDFRCGARSGGRTLPALLSSSPYVNSRERKLR